MKRNRIFPRCLLRNVHSDQDSHYTPVITDLHVTDIPDHSTPPSAMAEGVLRPPTRARLIIHHAKLPPARGTPVHKPSIALSHFSPPLTVRRLWALLHDPDAAAWSTFSRPAACSKSVASTSWAGRTMLRRSRGRAGPQGHLWGTDARSLVSVWRGGARPYFERPELGCFCELKHAV